MTDLQDNEQHAGYDEHEDGLVQRHVPQNRLSASGGAEPEPEGEDPHSSAVPGRTSVLRENTVGATAAQQEQTNCPGGRGRGNSVFIVSNPNPDVRVPSTGGVTGGVASAASSSRRNVRHPPTPEKPMLVLGAVSSDETSESDDRESSVGDVMSEAGRSGVPDGVCSNSSSRTGQHSRERGRGYPSNNARGRRERPGERRRMGGGASAFSSRAPPGRGQRERRSRSNRRENLLDRTLSGSGSGKPPRSKGKLCCYGLQAGALLACLCLLSCVAYLQYMDMQERNRVPMVDRNSPSSLLDGPPGTNPRISSSAGAATSLASANVPVRAVSTGQQGHGTTTSRDVQLLGHHARQQTNVTARTSDGGPLPLPGSPLLRSRSNGTSAQQGNFHLGEQPFFGDEQAKGWRGSDALSRGLPLIYADADDAEMAQRLRALRNLGFVSPAHSTRASRRSARAHSTTRGFSAGAPPVLPLDSRRGSNSDMPDWRGSAENTWLPGGEQPWKRRVSSSSRHSGASIGVRRRSYSGVNTRDERDEQRKRRVSHNKNGNSDPLHRRDSDLYSGSSGGAFSRRGSSRGPRLSSGRFASGQRGDIGGSSYNGTSSSEDFFWESSSGGDGESDGFDPDSDSDAGPVLQHTALPDEHMIHQKVLPPIETSSGTRQKGRRFSSGQKHERAPGQPRGSTESKQGRYSSTSQRQGRGSSFYQESAGDKSTTVAQEEWDSEAADKDNDDAFKSGDESVAGSARGGGGTRKKPPTVTKKRSRTQYVNQRSKKTTSNVINNSYYTIQHVADPSDAGRFFFGAPFAASGGKPTSAGAAGRDEGNHNTRSNDHDGMRRTKSEDEDEDRGRVEQETSTTTRSEQKQKAARGTPASSEAVVLANQNQEGRHPAVTRPVIGPPDLDDHQTTSQSLSLVPIVGVGASNAHQVLIGGLDERKEQVALEGPPPLKAITDGASVDAKSVAQDTALLAMENWQRPGQLSLAVPVAKAVAGEDGVVVTKSVDDIFNVTSGSSPNLKTFLALQDLDRTRLPANSEINVDVGTSEDVAVMQSVPLLNAYDPDLNEKDVHAVNQKAVPINNAGMYEGTVGASAGVGAGIPLVGEMMKATDLLHEPENDAGEQPTRPVEKETADEGEMADESVKTSNMAADLEDSDAKPSTERSENVAEKNAQEDHPVHIDAGNDINSVIFTSDTEQKTSAIEEDKQLRNEEAMKKPQEEEYSPEEVIRTEQVRDQLEISTDSSAMDVPQERVSDLLRDIAGLRKEIPLMLGSLKTYAQLVVRLHDGAVKRKKVAGSRSSHPTRVARRALKAFEPVDLGDPLQPVGSLDKSSEEVTGNKHTRKKSKSTAHQSQSSLNDKDKKTVFVNGDRSIEVYAPVMPTPELVLDRLVDLFGVDGAAKSGDLQPPRIAGTGTVSSALSMAKHEHQSAGGAEKEGASKKGKTSKANREEELQTELTFLRSRRMVAELTMQKLWLFISSRIGHFRFDLRADFSVMQPRTTPAPKPHRASAFFFGGGAPAPEEPETITYQHALKYECDFLGVKPHVLQAPPSSSIEFSSEETGLSREEGTATTATSHEKNAGGPFAATFGITRPDFRRPESALASLGRAPMPGQLTTTEISEATEDSPCDARNLTTTSSGPRREDGSTAAACKAVAGERANCKGTLPLGRTRSRGVPGSSSSSSKLTAAKLQSRNAPNDSKEGCADSATDADFKSARGSSKCSNASARSEDSEQDYDSSSTYHLEKSRSGGSRSVSDRRVTQLGMSAILERSHESELDSLRLSRTTAGGAENARSQLDISAALREILAEHEHTEGLNPVTPLSSKNVEKSTVGASSGSTTPSGTNHLREFGPTTTRKKDILDGGDEGLAALQPLGQAVGIRNEESENEVERVSRAEGTSIAKQQRLLEQAVGTKATGFGREASWASDLYIPTGDESYMPHVNYSELEQAGTTPGSSPSSSPVPRPPNTSLASNFDGGDADSAISGSPMINRGLYSGKSASRNKRKSSMADNSSPPSVKRFYIGDDVVPGAGDGRKDAYPAGSGSEFEGISPAGSEAGLTQEPAFLDVLAGGTVLKGDAGSASSQHRRNTVRRRRGSTTSGDEHSSSATVTTTPFFLGRNEPETTTTTAAPFVSCLSTSSTPHPALTSSPEAPLSPGGNGVGEMNVQDHLGEEARQDFIEQSTSTSAGGAGPGYEQELQASGATSRGGHEDGVRYTLLPTEPSAAMYVSNDLLGDSIGVPYPEAPGDGTRVRRLLPGVSPFSDGTLEDELIVGRSAGSKQHVELDDNEPERASDVAAEDDNSVFSVDVADDNVPQVVRIRASLKRQLLQERDLDLQPLTTANSSQAEALGPAITASSSEVDDMDENKARNKKNPSESSHMDRPSSRIQTTADVASADPTASSPNKARERSSPTSALAAQYAAFLGDAMNSAKTAIFEALNPLDSDSSDDDAQRGLLSSSAGTSGLTQKNTTSGSAGSSANQKTSSSRSASKEVVETPLAVRVSSSSGDGPKEPVMPVSSPPPLLPAETTEGDTLFSTALENIEGSSSCADKSNNYKSGGSPHAQPQAPEDQQNERSGLLERGHAAPIDEHLVAMDDFLDSYTDPVGPPAQVVMDPPGDWSPWSTTALARPGPSTRTSPSSRVPAATPGTGSVLLPSGSRQNLVVDTQLQQQKMKMNLNSKGQQQQDEDNLELLAQLNAVEMESESRILEDSEEKVSEWKMMLLEDEVSLHRKQKRLEYEDQPVAFDRLFYQCHMREPETFFRLKKKEAETKPASGFMGIVHMQVSTMMTPGSSRRSDSASSSQKERAEYTMVDARGLPRPLREWVPLEDQQDATLTIPIGYHQAYLELVAPLPTERKTRWLLKNQATTSGSRVSITRVTSNISPGVDAKEKSYQLASAHESHRLASKLGMLLA
ncbi:unnamed protein product [Amoebophrya sp. A25]|nr:unnamed protein product [Amoebophrya sp. A25]|eukprot:GSA25T00009775001.1